MAVIYLQPDRRPELLGQGLGQFFTAFAQARQDQAALQAAQQALEQNDPSSPAATPQRASPPTADAGGTATAMPAMQDPAQTPSPDGGPPQQVAGAPPPPNFTAAESIAARASPKVQALIQKMVDQRKWAYDQQVKQSEFQQTYTQKERSEKATEAHRSVTESQGERRIELEGQRVGLEGRRVQLEGQRVGMELQKFPLLMENLQTSIKLNQEKLKNLETEQASVFKPEELQQMAENYAAMGFKNPPNFGWGSTGPAALNRSGFWRAVNNLPMTPEQRQSAASAAHMQQIAAGQAGRVLANLDINLRKADELSTPLDEGFKKLEPILTKSPMFNRFKRAVLTGVGDPAFSGLDVYVRSFLVSYAKSLNPQGVLSEHFDEETSKMLDTISSWRQLQAKLKAIHVDMRLERRAVAAGRSDILGMNQNFGIIGGGTSGGPGGEPGSDDDPAGLFGTGGGESEE